MEQLADQSSGRGESSRRSDQWSGRGESSRESSQLADQSSGRGDQQPNSMLRGKSTVRYTGM